MATKKQAKKSSAKKTESTKVETPVDPRDEIRQARHEQREQLRKLQGIS